MAMSAAGIGELYSLHPSALGTEHLVIQGGFFEAVQNQYTKMVVSGTAKTSSTVSPADMTMDAYKQWIYDKISQLPMNPTQLMANYAIQISEAGFEAMKKEPEYEKWVLDNIKRNFSFNDPRIAICGTSYNVEYYGATKDEYRGSTWYPQTNGNGLKMFEENSEESFWERRIKVHKKNMETAKKLALKKEMMENLMRREEILDPDGKKQVYLAGVPASVLLGGLL